MEPIEMARQRFADLQILIADEWSRDSGSVREQVVDPSTEQVLSELPA